MCAQQLPIIALMTDFGTADAYAAAMKGVILGITPAARLVDLTHEIAPGDVPQAAYVLLTVYASFPAHTVFVVVVDPGVGTARRALAVETAHGRFVGPDNGVFSYVLRQHAPLAQVEITNVAYTLPQHSNTFHGRDIFAPAAAHLAAGLPLNRLGPPLRDSVALPQPRLDIAPGEVRGEVLHIDRFGNVVTSIGSLSWRDEDTLQLEPRFGAARRGMALPARVSVAAGGAMVEGVRRSYGLAAPGETVALVNSAGQLELAVNRGHAARALGVGVGDSVIVRFGEGGGLT